MVDERKKLINDELDFLAKWNFLQVLLVCFPVGDSDAPDHLVELHLLHVELVARRFVRVCHLAEAIADLDLVLRKQ